MPICCPHATVLRESPPGTSAQRALLCVDSADLSEPFGELWAIAGWQSWVSVS